MPQSRSPKAKVHNVMLFKGTNSIIDRIRWVQSLLYSTVLFLLMLKDILVHRAIGNAIEHVIEYEQRVILGPIRPVSACSVYCAAG